MSPTWATSLYRLLGAEDERYGINRFAAHQLYNPVRSFCTRVAVGKWAPVPAVLVTLLVSSLVHESTEEITCFFVVNRGAFGCGKWHQESPKRQVLAS